MKSNKVIALLREGFRFETLSKLNESQINTLYGRLIHEQSISAATQKAKEELVGLNKTVDDIAKKIASEEDNVEADDALGDLAMQTDTTVWTTILTITEVLWERKSKKIMLGQFVHHNLEKNSKQLKEVSGVLNK